MNRGGGAGGGRRRSVVDLLAGVGTAALVLGAVPVALAEAAVWPVPQGAARTALHLLVAAAWAAWAVCAWQLGRAIADRVRRGDVTVVAGARATDRLAARMAAAVLVVVPLVTSVHHRPVLPHRPPAPAAAALSGPADSATVPSALRPGPAPELAALGLGGLLAALAARRLSRERRRRSLRRARGAAPPGPTAGADAGPTAGALDLAVTLERTGDAALVARVEAANRALGDPGSAGPDGADAVRLLRAGPDGVDVWLQTAAGRAPDGWEVREGGRRWHLPAGPGPAAREGGAGAWPRFLVLLPVGEDDSGTWLVPLAPGTCLSVLGTRADDLVAAMVLALGSWEWADRVTVTGDPAVVARATADTGGADDAEAPALLFLGPPRALAPPLRRRCAVLTTEACDDTVLTLVVDAHHVTVHPWGVTLRPHLVDEVRRAALATAADLAAGTAAAGDRAGVAGGEADEEAGAPGTAAPVAAEGAACGPRVRLLAPVPRVEGLREEFEPKRERRGVELVAYLALHPGAPVTGDRLRTRVLGSADSDAAAKTLFNVVAAARRALGPGTTGTPLLPPAGRSGYRLSPEVRLDVLEMESLVARAAAAADDAARLALLRDALALVDGEPLAAVLGGYAWWTAEGHGGRLSGVVVDAACDLVHLALEAGRLDLAQWAVARARLVEPYSEALARAAMEAAARAGDTARLHAEWTECCRQVDELDPGAMPSEPTERLYSALVRRAPGPLHPGGTDADAAVQASLAAMEPAPRSTVPSAPAAL